METFSRGLKHEGGGIKLLLAVMVGILGYQYWNGELDGIFLITLGLLIFLVLEAKYRRRGERRGDGIVVVLFFVGLGLILQWTNMPGMTSFTFILFPLAMIGVGFVLSRFKR